MKKDRKVFDTESFIKECILKFGDDRFDYSRVKYVAAKKEVDIRCIKHDLWFSCQPYTHRIGKGGCPSCHSESMGQYHRLSVEDFVKRVSLIHQYIYDYSSIVHFKNAHEKVPIYCHKHGIFYQTVSNHLYNNYGCPTCAAIQRGLDVMVTQEEFLERSLAKHGDKFDYSEAVYSGYYEPVKLFCKEHNHHFIQRAGDHFSGVGCKFCIDKGYSRDKSGYLYVNKVGDNAAIKVGITNVCPIERAKVLDRKSPTYTIKPLYYFYHEDGAFIDDLETEILSKFPTGVIPKIDMKSGYTETLSCEYLPEIIDMIAYSFNEYKPR